MKTIVLMIIFVIVSVVSAFADAYWDNYYNPTIIVKGDMGGELIDYVIQAKAAKSVRIEGKCMSACTMYLMVQDLCITKNARFGFHLPYGLSPELNKKAEDYMLSVYPAWVLHWIYKHGGLTSKIKVMNYSYASKHLKTCDENLHATVN